VVDVPADRDQYNQQDEEQNAEQDAYRRLLERKERLKRISADMSQEDYREKMEVPAYNAAISAFRIFRILQKRIYPGSTSATTTRSWATTAFCTTM
jgi:hypothetical protein